MKTILKQYDPNNPKQPFLINEAVIWECRSTHGTYPYKGYKFQSNFVNLPSLLCIGEVSSHPLQFAVVRADILTDEEVSSLLNEGDR